MYHGKGTQTAPDGMVLEGSWDNDVLNGEATIT